MFLHWSGNNNAVDVTLDFTIVGSPAFSSAVKKFGTHSLSVAGVNQQNGVFYTPTPDITLGNFWTIEGWFYPVDPGAGKYGACDVFTVETTAPNEFGISADFGSGNVDWQFKVSTSAATDVENNTAYNVWRHIALVRNGSEILSYFDGVQTNDPAGDGPAETYGNINQITVGYTHDLVNGNPGTTGFNGFIDELRISKVARYTDPTSIAVPTTAFTTDSDTVFLRHFDNSYT